MKKNNEIEESDTNYGIVIFPIIVFIIWFALSNWNDMDKPDYKGPSDSFSKLMSSNADKLSQKFGWFGHVISSDIKKKGSVGYDQWVLENPTSSQELKRSSYKEQLAKKRIVLKKKEAKRVEKEYYNNELSLAVIQDRYIQVNGYLRNEYLDKDFVKDILSKYKELKEKREYLNKFDEYRTDGVFDWEKYFRLKKAIIDLTDLKKSKKIKKIEVEQIAEIPGYTPLRMLMFLNQQKMLSMIENGVSKDVIIEEYYKEYNRTVDLAKSFVKPMKDEIEHAKYIMYVSNLDEERSIPYLDGSGYYSSYYKGDEKAMPPLNKKFEFEKEGFSKKSIWWNPFLYQNKDIKRMRESRQLGNREISLRNTSLGFLQENKVISAILWDLEHKRWNGKSIFKSLGLHRYYKGLSDKKIKELNNSGYWIENGIDYSKFWVNGVDRTDYRGYLPSTLYVKQKTNLKKMEILYKKRKSFYYTKFREDGVFDWKGWLKRNKNYVFSYEGYELTKNKLNAYKYKLKLNKMGILKEDLIHYVKGKKNTKEYKELRKEYIKDMSKRIKEQFDFYNKLNKEEKIKLSLYETSFGISSYNNIFDVDILKMLGMSWKRDVLFKNKDIMFNDYRIEAIRAYLWDLEQNKNSTIYDKTLFTDYNNEDRYSEGLTQNKKKSLRKKNYWEKEGMDMNIYGYDSFFD